MIRYVYICLSRVRLEALLNDDDVRGNVRTLTYREANGPKRPILNKTMRNASAFYIYESATRKHHLGLGTETLVLIYDGRSSLFQFNF